MQNNRMAKPENNPSHGILLPVKNIAVKFIVNSIIYADCDLFDRDNMR